MNSCLYECHVMHARFAPRTHSFLYRIFLFAIDLDELESLHRKHAIFSLNRRNLYSFRDRDFLPTGEPLHNSTAPSPAQPRSETQNLKSRVHAHAATRGIDLTGGRVILVTLPRVLGYLFNPVSFYFCYDRHGAPACAIAEVTNTFKEMKPYFLGPETRSQPAEVRNQNPTSKAPPSPALLTPDLSSVTSASFRVRVPKNFYVSPYSDVDVAFDFTLRTPGDRLSIQIDDYVGENRMLTSTLTGPRRELTTARLAWFTLKYPALTLRIIALIHWQAFRLWLKRVPWFSKSARPEAQRDLYRPHSSLTRPTSSLENPPPVLAHRSLGEGGSLQPSDAA